MLDKAIPERQSDCAQKREETRKYVVKIRIQNSHLGGALTKTVVCKDSSDEVLYLDIINSLAALRMEAITPDMYFSFANLSS